MQKDITYDLAVIGGGLGGLSLSIQVARAGYSVVVFEKEKYPFHRVCGEYISNESLGFVESLGIDLSSLNVSHIKRLQVSDCKGNFFEQLLPLGGFGISRYLLDHQLALLAQENNVTVLEQTRVNEIAFADDRFTLSTTNGNFNAKIAAGCFGKRSNLDIKWKRSFAMAKNNRLNNYIGIKYHIKHDHPGDLISLHNFKNGYCGISRVENDKYCLCYLTTAYNLQTNGSDIRKMEQNILSANPHLKKIFNEGEMLWREPVTISQVSFDKKNLVEDHVLMIGDAAGMITPLCGNGMSMALHASKIAAEQIREFLKDKISRDEMEKRYSARWNKIFSNRMRAGRILQRLMLNNWLISFTIAVGKAFPFILRYMIRQTHGQRF